MPQGFSIDSFVPSPGWKRVEQSTGSGENTVIQKVAWTGGKVPTEEDALFQFLGEPSKSGTYTFTVQQTYSDGSIVNWTGSESSEDPAPTIEAKSSLGSGGGNSTLAIVALVVGGVGVLLGGLALLARSGATAGVSVRGRSAAVAAAALAALLLPAAASAHAYLVKTVPAASVTVNTPPPTVSLTFDEAVEPRFALISVTDVDGQPETSGAAAPRRLESRHAVVPLKRLPEGWYLVYWRAISVDGHPVQGAFTFAVGPNPGPAPQFVVPHISQTATTTPLLVARWAMFLTVMTAIGLFVLRMLIARPLVRRVEGTSLRALSLAFVVAAVLGLVALPVYLEESTAVDSLRSFWAFGALVPLWRTTAFGRGYVEMELCFALFCLAAWIALWVDRPQRGAADDRRSCSPLTGALLGAAARARRSRRGRSRGADGAARARGRCSTGCTSSAARSGSAGCSGCSSSGAACRPARRVAGLLVAVPRFSNVAFVCVLLLLGTRDRRDRRAPAGARGALADLVRQGDPGQDRDAAPRRCRSPRSTCCAASLGWPPLRHSRRSASGLRSCCAGSSPARRC